MKNMKKLLCVALGAALSFSLLAACSGGSATTPAPRDHHPRPRRPPLSRARVLRRRFHHRGGGQAPHVHQRRLPSL